MCFSQTGFSSSRPVRLWPNPAAFGAGSRGPAALRSYRNFRLTVICRHHPSHGKNTDLSCDPKKITGLMLPCVCAQMVLTRFETRKCGPSVMFPCEDPASGLQRRRHREPLIAARNPPARGMARGKPHPQGNRLQSLEAAPGPRGHAPPGSGRCSAAGGRSCSTPRTVAPSPLNRLRRCESAFAETPRPPHQAYSVPPPASNSGNSSRRSSVLRLTGTGGPVV